MRERYRLLRLRFNRWRHVREQYLEPTAFVLKDRIVAHPIIAAHVRTLYKAEGYAPPNRKARRAAKATGKQMATDVTTFLAWAAEPEMEERKRLGIKVILLLLVMTGLLFALKRKIWADMH